GGSEIVDKMRRQVKPIEEFTTPNDDETVRHGVWMSDELYQAHIDVQIGHNWRYWGDNLDPSELDENGLVKPQRSQGRYWKAKGTRTYFPTATAEAVTWPTLNDNVNENLGDTTAPSTGNVTDANVPNEETGRESFVFTSPTDEPNDAAWPSGSYRIQVDQGTIWDATVAIETLEFHRVNAAGTSSLENNTDTTDIASGDTFPVLRTITSSAWTAGDITDRAGIVLLTKNSSQHGGVEQIDVQIGMDMFFDGPWVAAVTDLGPVAFNQKVKPHTNTSARM
ncbi:MAG: hypothetical protein V3S69_00515, partial [Dehalococcoidales bacterium]